ncbi:MULTISPECIES: hypothetical protein [unclassified Mameliella]|nr:MULTISPECIES: hypothetical protein [unclassified Mameliella]
MKEYLWILVKLLRQPVADFREDLHPGNSPEVICENNTEKLKGTRG